MPTRLSQSISYAQLILTVYSDQCFMKHVNGESPLSQLDFLKQTFNKTERLKPWIDSGQSLSEYLTLSLVFGRMYGGMDRVVPRSAKKFILSSRFFSYPERNNVQNSEDVVGSEYDISIVTQ